MPIIAEDGWKLKISQGKEKGTGIKNTWMSFSILIRCEEEYSG